jgi:[ribosomal protein S5]-alanine N-acetyltransferase
MDQGVMEQGLVLETERLLLRKLTINDVSALQEVLGDPIAMQWYPAPFDRASVGEWIRRNMERYERDGHGLWAMILKSSGELIGDCGCVIQVVEDKEEVEIAYHVRRDLWGNGYATEGARACMEYAFNTLRAPRVISMIRPENINSRRVAEKNGLTCEKIVFWPPKGYSGGSYDHCIYAKVRT